MDLHFFPGEQGYSPPRLSESRHESIESEMPRERRGASLIYDDGFFAKASPKTIPFSAPFHAKMNASRLTRREYILHAPRLAIFHQMILFYKVIYICALLDAAALEDGYYRA